MKRNFTLIEILAVVAVIAILGTIGFAGYSYATNASKESATKATIARIAAALEAYKIKDGSYPKSGSSNQIVFHVDDSYTDANKEILFGDTACKKIINSKKSGGYAAFVQTFDADSISRCLNDSNQLTDGWGNPIYYRFPGKINKGSFDLISGGADGAFGSDEAATPVTDIAKYRDASGEWVCDDIANF